ncbi:MAG: UDP-3-O-acyl-N-acetylglucosamine deacetylase [Byssovorax sp.]
MLPRAVLLRGLALHCGREVAVELSAAPGPIAIEQRGARRALAEMVVARADRGVTIASPDGAIRLDLVEHLLAALGGLGVRSGLTLRTDDPELPLLDGGARSFCEALRALALAPAPPSLAVTREATFTRGASVYDFAPGRPIELEVDVVFRAPVGAEAARWSGDADDFEARIAPARTFGWVSDYEALRLAGRAAGVSLASVLVFDDAGALPGCAPAGEGEVARHKLLDLIGDLALHGGPPRGKIRARLPGHGATHAIVQEALAAGVLARAPEARW